MPDFNPPRRISGRQGLAPYGLRHSGIAPKGLGFFGAIPNPRGGISTELSAESDGLEYPLIVPTLSKEELNGVLSGQPSTEALAKALSHAISRRKQGLSPFAGPTDLRWPRPEK